MQLLNFLTFRQLFDKFDEEDVIVKYVNEANAVVKYADIPSIVWYVDETDVIVKYADIPVFVW